MNPPTLAPRPNVGADVHLRKRADIRQRTNPGNRVRPCVSGIRPPRWASNVSTSTPAGSSCCTTAVVAPVTKDDVGPVLHHDGSSSPPTGGSECQADGGRGSIVMVVLLLKVSKGQWLVPLEPTSFSCLSPPALNNRLGSETCRKWLASTTQMARLVASSLMRSPSWLDEVRPTCDVTHGWNPLGSARGRPLSNSLISTAFIHRDEALPEQLAAAGQLPAVVMSSDDGWRVIMTSSEFAEFKSDPETHR